ncbi:MAG: hypothetical protein D6765_05805, partial [Bacteroidetes bacterium]
PPAPARPTAAAMLAAEELLRERLAERLTILRMGGLVGPGREAGRFLAGKKAIPHPERRVNLVHLDDCLGAVRAVLESQAWGQTFNVVAPGHPTRKAFYTRQALQAGLEPPEFLPPTSEGPAGKVVSSEKLQQLPGFAFQKPDPMNW